jgi:hypothetical protein
VTSSGQQGAGYTAPHQYRTDRDVKAASRFAECLSVIASSPPMSADELAAYESQKARVRAEDERRREPSPQLELGQGE